MSTVKGWVADGFASEKEPRPAVSGRAKRLSGGDLNRQRDFSVSNLP